MPFTTVQTTEPAWFDLGLRQVTQLLVEGRLPDVDRGVPSNR